jgi:hypothetical protein
MAYAAQSLLPFLSLDFPGRDTVTTPEIAKKLGISVDHLGNLILDGTITALDLARHKGKSRACYRIAIEEYRKFILSRLTGEKRHEFLRELPEPVLRQLRAEIDRLIAA